MIYAIIVIVALSGIVVALAIIATIAILANQRLQRDRASLHRSLQDEQIRADEWSEEAKKLRIVNASLQQENAALKARETALQKAIEAQPTQQPKRATRKSSTRQEEV